MALELDDILKLLKIDEEKFLNLSKEDWETKVNQEVTDANQKNELMGLSELEGPQGRGIFFRNTLFKNSQPPDPNFSPVMNFRLIQRFLKIDQAEFLTMKPADWTECVNKEILTRRNQQGNSQELDDREAYLLSLAEISARKQFFVDSSPQYIPLQKAANGTPANITLQKEQNPKTVIAPQGYDSPSLYTVMGDKPKDREKNITAILKAHEEFMGKHYDTLPKTEQDKYGSKQAFLETFKGKKTYFKDFEALEKSAAWDGFSDATKELYKAQKGDFPMNIIILPVEKKENATQLMDKIKDHIKPMPPAAKKEEEKAKAEAGKPETPLPGAETQTPSTTPRPG